MSLHIPRQLNLPSSLEGIVYAEYKNGPYTVINIDSLRSRFKGNRIERKLQKKIENLFVFALPNERLLFNF